MRHATIYTLVERGAGVDAREPRIEEKVAVWSPVWVFMMMYDDAKLM